jgi:hypothetical protein
MVLWGYDAWKDRVELGNRGAALRQNGGFSLFCAALYCSQQGAFRGRTGDLTCNQNRRLRNPTLGHAGSKQAITHSVWPN